MRIHAFLSLVAIQVSSFAASEDVMGVREAMQKHLLLVAALPEYPSETEAAPGVRHRRYTCLFELKFDYESGHLREVHVVRSSGDRAVDARMIGAMKVWQAKPRSIHNLLVAPRLKPMGTL